MKQINIILLLFSVICYQAYSQVNINDSLYSSYDELLIQMEEENFKVERKGTTNEIERFSQSREMKYEKVLLKEASYCHIVMFKVEGKIKKSLFYEYNDSITCNRNFKYIKDCMINEIYEELGDDFKSTYFFKYKNILCQTSFYSDELSKLSKKISGEYLLFPLRVSKYESIETRNYWNFIR